MPSSRPASAPPLRSLIYARDEHGSPYAVEIVEAARWDAALLTPPDPADADARVVRLRRGTAPAELPRWLHVERSTRERKIAETPGGYGSDDADSADPPSAAAGIGASLWPWSPTFRGPGPSLAEFLAAGAAAIRHPDPAPAERRRRRELLADFATSRPSPLAEIAALEGDALERWLRVHFGVPERLADELLLARMEEAEPDVAGILRFLRDAEVPPALAAHAELAIDRRVLLEQASPWRYFDGLAFQGALSAVQAWRRRYRIAYDAHYRNVLTRAAEIRAELQHTRPAAETLRRLDALDALGKPVGQEARVAFELALQALETLPDGPDPEQARTAGVTLGIEPPVFAHVNEVADEIHAALEVQRRRLASTTVRAILAREGIPALDRLLQAIAASELDALERVLDDDLAAHIGQLLVAAETSPLARLAERHPIVTADEVDAVIESLRELLVAGVTAAPDGRVVLREDRA